MAGLKESSCRLCLKDITDKGFQVIDDVTRNILDTLLLKLKFYGETKEVICNACNRKLNAAFLFKSTCLNNNSTIIPHVDFEKMLQLDLQEVYVKKNGSEHLEDISCNHKICRLCIQLIKDEIRYLGEKELDAIHNFVPEINISIIKDPVICKTCFDSLCTHNTFLKDCVEVEQKIGDIYECSATENHTDTSPHVVFIKTENLDKESEINEREIGIKTECVDIKPEEDEERRDKLLLLSNNETLVNSDCNGTEEELKHMQKYKTISVMYKCETCKFVTKTKRLLKKHKLKHKDSSEVQMHKCDACTYESRYKDNVIKHQWTHKDPSEVQMYSCNECDYKTKYKSKVARHSLRHKNPSELQMHKCNDCDYESKHMENFTNHQLIHKNSTEVPIYKCKACDYESRYKDCFTRHQLIHKKPWEVQMYRCSKCDYKTKYKNNLTRHVLQHKNPSQMYKCNACDYEARYKTNLSQHQLVHKDPLEVQVHECKDCDYKTIYSKRFARHAVRHKNPRVQTYKCDACDYKSRYKRNIIAHQWTHKESSEAQKSECNDHDNKTKFNFKIIECNALKHKDSCVQMYKCDTCNFQTKYKSSLKCHELKHKQQS